VTADPDRLSQVIANLLSNALKFTPEAGTVTVTVEDVTGEKGRGVKVSVRDTGHGIPADQIASLFSRFQQVKSLTREKNEGSGLGLSLVRELVQRFGGEVGVESIENQGSVFFFIIPSMPSKGEGNA
jgi:signal transduction histidine kinase